MRTRWIAFLCCAVALAAPYACGGSDESGVGGGVGGIGPGPGTGTLGPGTDASTTSSSSTGGGSTVLACGAPSDAPSKGHCVTVTPGTGGGSASASAGAGGGADSVGAGGAPGTGGAGASGGAGGAGGNAGCSQVFNQGTCADCLVQNCCAETTACNETSGCIACFVNDASATGCADAPIADPLMALQACESQVCGLACGLRVEYHCNPVTNEGCDTAAGYACDLGGAGSFDCFGPPNPQAICQMCSVTQAGPYCMAGLHCIVPDSTSTTGECARFCCDDGDCGPGGRCDKTKILTGAETEVGVCFQD